MSTLNTHEDFTPAERRALETWETPSPPEDLAARVLSAALVQQQAQRATRVRWAMAAGGVAAALLLALTGALYWATPRPSVGQEVVQARRTLNLGERAVVVAEGGTRLSWRIIDGDAQVHQPSGNAFYRVERGGPFEVRVPHGHIRVLGTCFRVEVKPMKASRAGLTGAATGAALATVVLVTVYEGRVITASPSQQVTVEAGQSASLAQSRPPALEQRGDEESSRPARRITGAPSRPTQDPASTHGSLLQENQQLAARTKELEREVQELHEKMASPDTTKKTNFVDPPSEELVAMARRCEISYDTPSLGSTAPTVSSGRSKELGLNETEKAAIDKVMSRTHKKAIALLRQLYIEATGQAEVADTLSPGAMRNEIDDKTREDQKKEIFQRLAQERAGLAAPPPDLTTLSPGERMYRMLTTMGDQIEKQMGQEIGPDLARRYREIKGGFGSRSRHRNGCPRP